MHKLFKNLTIFSFVVGSFLYFSYFIGDVAYFSYSGGTGLTLLAIGTPVFAILTYISRGVSTSQTNPPAQRRPRKLFWFGLFMTIAGFLLYFASFIEGLSQDLGGLALAMLGALALLVGVIVLAISALRR